MISVILTVYNKENTLVKTIKSVLAQSFTSFEFIIIDDGSTDNSLSVIKKFKDARINHYSTENKGISKARNYGIFLSKMDYIAFIDADDYWLPNHLEMHAKLINDYKEGSLFCTKYKVIKDYYSYFPKVNIKDKNFRGIVTNFFEASTSGNIAWTGCVTVKKKHFFDHKTVFSYNLFDDIILAFF